MATVRELLKEYNDTARRRGIRKGHARELKSWKRPKIELESLVAQLRRERAEWEMDGEKLTIGRVAEDALVEVVGEDEDGNELGHPYEDILAIVRRFFPQAETTARSLAWYASKMRCAGTHVPYRPRARRSS